MQDLAHAGEEQDAEIFTTVVADYDSVSPLDPWMTTILLRIKRQIAGDKIEL